MTIGRKRVYACNNVTWFIFTTLANLTSHKDYPFYHRSRAYEHICYASTNRTTIFLSRIVVIAGLMIMEPNFN